MKKIVFIICVVVASSCSKKEAYEEEAVYIEPKYDTTAIDSFSAGATSVNVANQIKMSSKKYQDSLTAVFIAQEAQRKKQKMQDSLKALEAKKEKEKLKETGTPEVNNTTSPN